MCTNFKTPIAEDGTVVVGRSVDYPALMGFQLCVIPSGLARVARADAGVVKSKKWTTLHGVVGLSIAGNDAAIFDGMNDAGLSAHALYMVGGFFHTPEFKGDGTDVSQTELASYLLSTCATIDEVRAVLEETNVWGWNGACPSHRQSTFWFTIERGRRQSSSGRRESSWSITRPASVPTPPIWSGTFST